MIWIVRQRYACGRFRIADSATSDNTGRWRAKVFRKMAFRGLGLRCVGWSALARSPDFRNAPGGREPSSGRLLHADAEPVLQLIKGGQAPLLERLVPEPAEYLSHGCAVLAHFCSSFIAISCSRVSRQPSRLPRAVRPAW